MLEKMDLNKRADKETLGKELKEAQLMLGLLQRRCREDKIPVMIVFEGMGAAGKGIQINRLIQALDPRGFHVYACERETEEERLHPFLWRYWIKTPERGRIAIFDRSWYRSIQEDRFEGLVPEERISDACQDILSFEKQLSDDGTVIIKLFLAIDKKEQKKRFKRLGSRSETAWQVTKEDWKQNHEYERYLRINEKMLERTDTDYAPWTIIEATDADYAALKIITTVAGRLSRELEERKAQKGTRCPGQQGAGTPV